MRDIAYYQISRSTAEQVLARLLDRTLKARQRAVVVCADAEKLEALDQALWTVTDPQWLPHGTAATGHASLQPIWLSLETTSVNAARYLFLVDVQAPAIFHGYERVFDVFNGTSETALAHARERWRKSVEAENTQTYWREGLHGWERQL